MAMLHKWATGSNKKDNTKTVDGGHDGHMEASGDFAYELANTELTEGAGQVAGASTPYTLEKAKQYSATGRQNLGGATKTANQTTKKLDWWNILRMWKWRKIHKMRGKHGETLYEA